MLPPEEDPEQLQLFLEKCHAGMLAKLMVGLSIAAAYKGWKPCHKVLLTPNEKRLFQFLQKKGLEDNNLELYFEKDKIDELYKIVKEIVELEESSTSSLLSEPQRKKRRKKIKKLRKKKERLIKNYFVKKKPKLKMVPSTVKEWISRKPRGKQFLREIDRFKCLVCILQLAIALAIPPLCKPMIQYIIKKGKIDGSENGALDLMVYGEGHWVFPHTDLEDYIVEEMPSLGAYIVAKIDPESTSCIFCNSSEERGNCCWKDIEPENVNYGGHQELDPLCVYFMVRKAVHGGPYHSLHGKMRKGARNLWCGFDSQQITMVLRPFLS